MKKNKLKHGLLLMMVLSSLWLHAQQTTDASGGTATGTGGSVSYSVGQVVYSYRTGTGGWLIEGVQQPKEFTNTLATNDFTALEATCKLYPNPTSNALHLTFSTEGYVGCEAVLTDLAGKMLQKVILKEATTTLELEYLPIAPYVLTVTKNNQIIKSFKIIKN
jgi:hypothetical protein